MSEQPDIPAGTDTPKATSGSRKLGTGTGTETAGTPAVDRPPVTGKGRPTPKRSAAQKRRTGPVPPPPTTRKEAAQRLRASQAEQRKQVREGTLAGDERRMLPRDAGPVRAAVRDAVDGRRNVGVLLLPVALLSVLAQITRVPQIVAVMTSLFFATLLAAIVDLVLTGVRLRREIGSRFPEEPLRGHISYGLLRTTTFRRFRMPPPRVRPGSLLSR